MYIDDGSDSGELSDVDGHEYTDGVVDSVSDLVGGHDMHDGIDDITVDTPNGPHDIGPATIDTNADGHPDTAVVHDAAGDTVMYTDGTGAGQAGVATEFTPDGEVVTAEHTGPGQWTVVERGHLATDGQFHADDTAGGEFTPPLDPAADQTWSNTDGDEGGWAAPFTKVAFSEAGSARGVVRIDDATGQWISQN